MAIDITSLAIQDEFGNAVTDFSLLNITDKVTLTYGITVAEYAITDIDNPIILNYTSGMIGTGWAYDARGGFKNFKIGDTVERKHYTTNAFFDGVISFTVIDKLDDFHVQFSSNLTLPDNASANTSIFNIKTPITAINYFWNFIENTASNDYNSKVDGSLQKLFNNSTSQAASVAPMIFSGTKPYQIGSATIAGAGLNTTIIYGQKFTIIHNTFVTPFLLSNQITDLENGINPSYFLNGQALKNIFKIEAMYNFNDPNRMLTYESSLDENLDLIGNTGGFNENFNTGITNYYIDSVALYNGATALTALELTTTPIEFYITIKNTVNNPFSNNNSKFTIGFVKVPFDATEYQLNGRTLAQNFCFDRAHNTVGAVALNGNNFGTTYQVFTDVAASFTNSNTIVVSGYVALAANVLSIIQESSEYKYMLFVSVQDHTKTSLASNCDRVNLIASMKTFFVNNADPGLVVIANTFIEHPHENIETQSTPKVDIHTEDEVAAISLFYIDKLGRETDTISIDSIAMKIKAFNSTNDNEFTLDSYTFAANGLPVINGNQYVDTNIPRIFHIEESVRKQIKIIRRTDLDTATKFYYQIVFPFVVRWEYWLALQNVNQNFFNVSQPLNGFNNKWFRYANGTTIDWRTFFELTVNVKKNGDALSYSNKTGFGITDYQTLTGDSIKTFDSTFVTELYNAVTNRKYISSTEDTGLQATFTMDAGYQLSGCFVCFHIQTKEGNGVSEFRRYSSVNVQDADTYFKSIGGNDKVDLATPTATTLRARCLIDKTLIPVNTPIYSISARLYYITPPLTNFLAYEDATAIYTEALDFLVIE